MIYQAILKTKKLSNYKFARQNDASGERKGSF